MSPDAPSTLTATARGWQPRRGHVLLVFGEQHFSTHELPDDGVLVVGRDAEADVAVSHPKLSRRHALVRGGPVPRVNDLGSTNGVWIGGRRLAAGEEHPLAPGTSFHIGPFTAVVVGDSLPVGESSDGRARLIVADPRPGALSEVVVRIARSSVCVLITGETGAGKDVLARSIHGASGRTGPIVSLNCAALSETLLETELFGHERGAFTGAVAAKPGLLEVASGGTVFLDEVGDMPSSMQSKLLRAIEARQVLRVGGRTAVDLDVRFVAATLRDLRAEVAAGTFRQDLYFRLNGITLTVPPLRERRDAIAGLADGFLTEASERAGRRVPALRPTAVKRLVDHTWPGNVRELRTVMERALLLSSGDSIGARDIVLDVPMPSSETPVPAAADGSERARIVAALEACGGNQSHAAKQLGIARSTLVHKMAVHGVARERAR